MALKSIKPAAILLVDDEVNVARTLQMILEQEGYAVTVAFSAAEALAKFKAGLRPNIVITDLNMEKDDIGLDVARAAQRMNPRPLVVICTGYANVENAGIALEMRVDHLLTKPVSIDELRTSLSKLTQARTVLKPLKARPRAKKKGASARG